MLLLSDLILRIQYHQYNFFSFIDYMHSSSYLDPATTYSRDGLSVRDAHANVVNRRRTIELTCRLQRSCSETSFLASERVMSVSTDEHVDLVHLVHVCNIFKTALKQHAAALARCNSLAGQYGATYGLQVRWGNASTEWCELHLQPLQPALV